VKTIDMLFIAVILSILSIAVASEFIKPVLPLMIILALMQFLLFIVAAAYFFIAAITLILAMREIYEKSIKNIREAIAIMFYISITMCAVDAVAYFSILAL